MRLIHADGFKKDERRHWRAVIFNNLIHAMRTVMVAMDENDIDFDNEANEKYVDMIHNAPDLASNEPMPTSYLAVFEDLWQDSGVRMAVSKGNEYALHDNLEQ